MSPELVILEAKIWSVVRTMARAEKKLAEYCACRGITCYLPLRRSVRRYGRKVVESQVPMFPGYAFVQADSAEARIVSESRHSAQLLTPSRTAEQGLVADLQNVRILEAAMQAGEVLVCDEIVPGETVRVRSGPLVGLTGVVQRRQQLARVMVNVDLIGQSVGMELDVELLERY